MIFEIGMFRGIGYRVFWGFLGIEMIDRRCRPAVTEASVKTSAAPTLTSRSVGVLSEICNMRGRLRIQVNGHVLVTY